MSHNLISDQKTRLSAVLWIIDHEPNQPIPSKVFKSLAQDPLAYQQLSSAYDKAIAAHPEWTASLISVAADMDSSFGHGDRGMARFAQAIEAHPKDAILRNNACWARATKNIELDKAMIDCDAAISLQPEGGFFDSRGLVHLQRGEWAAAISDYDAALAKMPQLNTSRFGRGIAETHLGKADEAKSDLAAARLANSKIDETFVGYGLKP
ncbi:tetratricopeptide repeat protein [Sphingomonas vulcanisoli]|uniref:tetratricopeptide repeat protein n=1 Tax=Sphingomonas vulcanisoli TaxID=1658060 RepID=UPI001423D243|nr:hypothetical protein [Sphingomonas vulcanisoli]